MSTRHIDLSSTGDRPAINIRNTLSNLYSGVVNGARGRLSSQSTYSSEQNFRIRNIRDMPGASGASPDDLFIVGNSLVVLTDEDRTSSSDLLIEEIGADINRLTNRAREAQRISIVFAIGFISISIISLAVGSMGLLSNLLMWLGASLLSAAGVFFLVMWFQIRKYRRDGFSPT